MRFANGDEYDGRWERDDFNGKGKYFFNQRETLNGFFKNGKIVTEEEEISKMQLYQPNNNEYSRLKQSNHPQSARKISTSQISPYNQTAPPAQLIHQSSNKSSPMHNIDVVRSQQTASPIS